MDGSLRRLASQTFRPCTGPTIRSDSEDEAAIATKLTNIVVPSIRSRAAHRLASARISINRMDLLHSPIPLRFDKWNDRSLVERYAKVLQRSFQTRGVRSFEMENMLPLVIRKDHLESECLKFKGLNAAEAPFLQLSPEGLKASSIKVAGGRHRFRAVELETKRLLTEMKRLKSKIQDDDGATDEEKDMNRAYRVMIDTLSKEKERVCTWGVIIYDEELLLAEGEMLATELSRNEKKFQYAESDGERLLMTFRTWRSLEGDRAEDYLKSVGKNMNSGLAQVVNHQESREFLMALYDMQPHFHYTEPLTLTWIKRYIHSISGGIIIYISLYGVRLWKSLLSKTDLFAMSDPNKLGPYLTALKQPPAQRPDEWDRVAITAWKAMAEPEHVIKLDVHYDMLSVAMMSQFRNVNSTLIRTLLTKTPSEAPSDWEAYKAIVKDVYQAYIKHEPVEGEAKTNVRKMFWKKVEWFLTHHDTHYARPMPMLTSAVILELNAMMQTIEPAVIEFARWFDPYAEYFYQNHKNTETPKDLTSHMLRTISTNAGDIFKQPGNAARELAHIPLKYYAAFLKLTEDMKAFESKSVRPRTSPEQKPGALEKKYEGLTEGVELLKKLMKENKKGGPTGNWVLDFVGCYDWRNGSKIKNISRDFIRWAIPAYLEVEIVRSYRPTLLKQSQAAKYLRFIAAETLSCYVKTVNRLNGAGSYEASHSYLYPDRLQTTTSQPIEAPEVHVTNLMERMKEDEDLKISLKELTRDVKKIVRLRCLSAKPDSTEMSPHVHTALETFIQAATTNAYRLRDMKAEPNLRNVDPLDERWANYEVVQPIVVDLPTVWSKDSVGGKALARNKTKSSRSTQASPDPQACMLDESSLVAKDIPAICPSFVLWEQTSIQSQFEPMNIDKKPRNDIQPAPTTMTVPHTPRNISASGPNYRKRSQADNRSRPGLVKKNQYNNGQSDKEVEELPTDSRAGKRIKYE